MAKAKASTKKSAAKAKQPTAKAKASAKTASPKAASSKAASNKAASSKAASNKAASNKAASTKASALAPVVRDVVARVAAIDWNGISGEQATGFATQFALLAAGGKPAVKAFATIRTLLGDSGHTMPIAGLAIPFLLELVAHMPGAEGAALVAYLTNAAMFGHAQWIDSGFAPPAHDGGLLSSRSRARIHAAFSAGARVYRSLLLLNSDAKARATGAFALGFARDPDGAAATDALRLALSTESDAGTRASLLLALAMTDRGSIASVAAPNLAASAAEERLAAAIAGSLGDSADPRVLAILRADSATRLTSPWFGGNAAPFARHRAMVSVFGAPPDERPSAPPTLNESQVAELRLLLGAETPTDVGAFARALGLPDKDSALRRFAGIPRAIPVGKHAGIYDRWMTWAETGQPEAHVLAAELAAEIAAVDFAAIVELMGFAEQENQQEHASFTIPFAPNIVPPPGKPDVDRPGNLVRSHGGTVDEAVTAYEAFVRAEGYATWSHGHDGENDFHEGNVHAWHPDGREVEAGFRERDGVIRGSYKFGRSLLRPFAAAMANRHGAQALHASLRTQIEAEMRLALVLLRAGWAIADHTRVAPDPVCDELAFTGGKGRAYIYGPVRAHIERLAGERRVALVLRLMKADDFGVFGWVRFADTPEIRRAAHDMLVGQLTTSSSFHDLDVAERRARLMAPWVDDGARKLLRRHVADDKNPVIQVLLLARDGDWDAIRPALESEYPMAREAARKVLAAAPKP